MFVRLGPLAVLALAGACVQAPVPPAPATEHSSILAGSTPPNGATVAGPIDAIELRFNPPALLGEVTVTGPSGVMPMMVSAVGEVELYSLPVSVVAPGRYTVNWKALAAGTENRGSFGFTVR